MNDIKPANELELPIVPDLRLRKEPEQVSPLHKITIIFTTVFTASN